MAEKIVSPGVFTRENDLSFVQQGVGAIGAAIVGPTVKGPALVPTKVFSYSDYQALFGDSFKSGSDYYQYFTSITAKEYLKHGGPLTVVRVLPALGSPDYSNATASAHIKRTTQQAISPKIHTWSFVGNVDDGTLIQYSASNGTAYLFQAESGVVPANNTSQATNETGTTTGVYYFGIGAAADSGANDTPALFVAGNTGSSGGTFNAITGDTLVSMSDATLVSPTFTISGSETNPVSDITIISGSITSGSVAGTYPAATSTAWVAATASWGAKAGVPKALNNLGTAPDYNNFTASFQIKTIGDGTVMNSTPPDGAVGTNDVLTVNNVIYGTENNLRWEVGTVNNKKGSFTLIIRRGDDSSKRKVILETFSNCSLDPKALNYLGINVGTMYDKIDLTDAANPFIQPNGSYPRKSKYVYIDEASVLQTVNYLDDNGEITNTTYTGSLPLASSGSFGGGSDGELKHPQTFYEDAGQNNTNVQGFNISGNTQAGYKGYKAAFDLLKNADEYDINLLIAPGLNNEQHPGLTTEMINLCEERGDVMTIIDPVRYSNTLAAAAVEAGERDSSYAAMYWPWVQIADPMTGKYVWVPQSAIMPGIYAFNDKVSAEWFAPAGLNRGGQETVVQAERKLTHANRDELYEASVNPVATFPGEGVVVWGQKTLQKKASALDRVNVRRLLINLKKFIASVSKYLIFENNTAATRNRFLSQVNPYMESVQQRQGLYAFKVIMDESNNTPDIIDRNIMKGDIFIQPAKAAEFIVIDFNIMPTGATFND